MSFSASLSGETGGRRYQQVHKEIGQTHGQQVHKWIKKALIVDVPSNVGGCGEVGGGWHRKEAGPLCSLHREDRVALGYRT